MKFNESKHEKACFINYVSAMRYKNILAKIIEKTSENVSKIMAHLLHRH